MYYLSHQGLAMYIVMSRQGTGDVLFGRQGTGDVHYTGLGWDHCMSERQLGLRLIDGANCKKS